MHTIQSAPETSRPLLTAIREDFGSVPNLAGVMTESPTLLSSEFGPQRHLKASSLLSEAETNVVRLSIAVENGCRDCAAAHAMAGKVFFRSPDEVKAAIRGGRPIGDPRLRALRAFALDAYEQRGRVGDEALEGFVEVGYSHGQALEVVTSIAAKVRTNFTNQLVGTPLDAALEPFAAGLASEE